MTITAQARRVRPSVSPEVAALAGLPAGPELCAALARIDISKVSGYEMVLVLKARARQGNYERGMFLAAVAETMRRTDPGQGRLAEPDWDDRRKWNVAELRCALTLTRTAANQLAGLAQDLSRRLPAVLAAMVSGRLDQPRARVFSTWTELLADRHTEAVVKHLLPRAHRMTTGELIEAIQRAAIELDPRWARRRYETALKKRQVKGVLRPDGTADLTGTNLPADQVAAACDRIDALAHRLKQAGYPSLLSWIRADIYLGKLDGRYEGLSDDELFEHMMANPVPKPAPDPEPRTPDDDPTPEEQQEYLDYLTEHGLLPDPEDLLPGNYEEQGDDQEHEEQGDAQKGTDDQSGEPNHDAHDHADDEGRNSGQDTSGRHEPGDKAHGLGGDEPQQSGDNQHAEQDGSQHGWNRGEGRDGAADPRPPDVDDRPDPDDPPDEPPGPRITGPDRPTDTTGGGAHACASTSDTSGTSLTVNAGPVHTTDPPPAAEPSPAAEQPGPEPAGPPIAGPSTDGSANLDDTDGRPDFDGTPNANGAPRAGEPAVGGPAAGGPGAGSGVGRASRAADAWATHQGRVRGRGLRLLVGLTTLAGLDRRPGQLLGFGFVHAELARRISATPAARWCYALVQPDGTPIQVGLIRRRPRQPWAEGHIPGYRQVEVWLQLTPDELARLTTDPPPGWRPVIASLARRIATHPRGAPTSTDPAARLPGRLLRRWLHLRDRRCVFPGCRIAPHRGDADHTIDYARGGLTTAANIGSLCRPDHQLRHQRGWRLHQPRPGQFTWTSPLGHHYQRNPPPAPADTLAPMTRPVRICEDPYIVWVSGDLGYQGNETCKIIIPPPPPPPPPPEPLGDPPF